MKIAYDSQIFFAQTYGGISRYFCEVASRIAKEPGFQVSITAPMHVNAYLSHVPPGIVSGFRVPKLERSHRSKRTNYPRLFARGLSLLIEDTMLRAMNPDIVHETYFFPYRLGSQRARRVLTIYDMIHEKFASNFSESDKTSRNKALAVDRADHVICISESTQRDVIKILGLPSDKLSVVHLGFDMMDTAKSIPEKFLLPDLEPFLLYVGNRGGYKNFLRLLEAYGTSQQLKTGYKLICFGGGPINLEELKAMQALGLDSDRVLQFGGDDHLLSKLYKGASVFIYPSLYEGFGIPPLEAMSHDCPVACSNTSSIPEVVGDAGEYFDPSNTENMRASIERIVTSAKKRELLITKGRARLKCFSWRKCAAETLDIYRKLV